MDNVTEINLHPEQWKAYNFVKPYGLILCGTKGGKTFLGSILSQKKIGEYPLGNGLIAAPTVKILQQATLDTFFKLFPEWLRYFKKQESVIELPTGGKVYVRSTDDPLALEGFNLDWAWLDEAGMMSRNTWSIIKNKVAISRGQIFMTTNAYYLNWLYKELYIPVLEGKEKDVEIFNWKSIDNPYFPKDFALKEKERLLPAEYARRYEGRFVRMEGLVWTIDDSNILELTPDLKEYLDYPERVILGVDWGFAKPAGIVVIKQKDSKYYVVDEWKEAKTPTNEIIQKCTDYHKKYLAQIAYPDPAEPDRIEELKKSGMPVGDVNKDIVLGIGKVQELFKSHRLFILSGCKDLLDEIEQYRYENPRDDTRDKKEVPIKSNDHLCLSGNTKILMKSGNQKLLKNILIGDFVRTKNGVHMVVDRGLTKKNAEVIKIKLSDGKELIGTENHKIYTERGKISLDALRYDDKIEVYNKQILLWKKQSSLMERDIILTVNTILQSVDVKTEGNGYIKKFGLKNLDKYLTDTVFITKMETEETIKSLISDLSRILTICRYTQKKDCKNPNIKRKIKYILKGLDLLQENGTLLRREGNGTRNTGLKRGLEDKKLIRFAKFVEKNIKHIFPNNQDFATQIVKRERCGREDVYNLTVEGEHNYYANGILVSNCDSLRYAIIGNELGQSFTYQEEKYEKHRIEENRQSRREFELL